MSLYSPEAKLIFGSFEFGVKPGVKYPNPLENTEVLNSRVIIREPWHGGLKEKLKTWLFGTLSTPHLRSASISDTDQITLKPYGGLDICTECQKTEILNRNEINQHLTTKRWFYYE